MRPSPILTGYMARHFILSFVSVLVVIMGLVLLFDSIELLRRTASKSDADFFLVMQMAVLKLPQMVHTVLPFAVMLGAMITFWKMTRSSELVIIRSAGVSVWGFLLPVLFLALAIGVFNVAVVNPVSAAMYKQYEHFQDRLMMRHSNPLALTEHGLWLRETKGDIQSVVYAGHVRQENYTLFMRDMSIFEFKSGDSFIRRFEAKIGTLGDGVFKLEKARLLEPGKAEKNYEKLNLPTTLTLGKIQENFSSPDTLSFWELPGFIKFFESAGFSAYKHRLHWHALLVSPFLLCAMVLVAAVFSLKPNQRQGGLLIRIVGGVGAGFLLFFFTKVIFALGLSAALPLALAAWSPVVIASLLSLAFLLHKEDG